MDLKSAFARARRGLREELRLYMVAVSSLAVAFLCLGTVLLALTNLDSMADRWGRTGRMTVYLADGAQRQDVAQLEVVLEGLAEIASVERVSSEEARAEFLAQSDVSADFSSLPAEVFPASLEVGLRRGTSVQRVDAISRRVMQFRGVSDVETYRGWFERLESLLDTGHGISVALAMLVSLCVFAVIGNTIRLAVARRQREIEVMKLCGATDGFVRGPFVLEGVFQGIAAAVASVIVLGVGFLLLRDEVDATVAALTGVDMQFLHPAVFVGLIFSGAFIGGLGSAISVRRYLTV